MNLTQALTRMFPCDCGNDECALSAVELALTTPEGRALSALVEAALMLPVGEHLAPTRGEVDFVHAVDAFLALGDTEPAASTTPVDPMDAGYRKP